VSEISLGDERLLMAEDAYALLGIIGADAWAEVASRVKDLQVRLANWTTAREPGVKIWDVYLVVLLASRLATAEELTEVRDLVDDLRLVRKIVRPGVELGRPGLEKALAPFLALRAPERSVSSPLEALEGRLLARGIDQDLVTSAIASFKETGEVTVP
jgi:hypothetical protein